MGDDYWCSSTNSCSDYSHSQKKLECRGKLNLVVVSCFCSLLPYLHFTKSMKILMQVVKAVERLKRSANEAALDLVAGV